MFFVKWFLIPWLIFIIIVGVYLIYYKNEKYELKPFVDLSSVDIKELLIMDKKRAISEGVNIEENMPKFYKGNNNIGVLLIHGFTASPYEMSFLANYLNSKGYTVYNARVAGHGSRPENLNLLTYEDWYESLKYGYYVLKNSCDKIVVVGQSMGGLLAYVVATFNDVDKVVMLVPGLGIKSFKFKLVPILKNFIDFVKKENFSDDLKEYYYNVRPLKALFQLKLLIEYTWSILNKRQFPVYIIYSEYDDVIDNKKIVNFYNKLDSSKKKIDLIKQKDIKHVLTLNSNPVVNDIFGKIEEWIREE